MYHLLCQANNETPSRQSIKHAVFDIRIKIVFNRVLPMAISGYLKVYWCRTSYVSQVIRFLLLVHPLGVVNFLVHLVLWAAVFHVGFFSFAKFIENIGGVLEVVCSYPLSRQEKVTPYLILFVSLFLSLSVISLLIYQLFATYSIVIKFHANSHLPSTIHEATFIDYTWWYLLIKYDWCCGWAGLLHSKNTVCC